ncbi:hypothetical protein [Lactobacillus melliventris]|uniref:Gp2 phage-like protein n=1 Tax=Lactobacillus melliventris TaxID=1218507 RepID=A0ABX5N680_9LACO|nr:hypothetical protein [Lactobacillus melliventris]PXY86228.1 hypothetical protein DK873_01385 [Lactobacillus melliventris]
MVKIGFRKPSLKRSISARTKGRATRAIKRAIIPNYGKRGMGWAHPRRKIYNSIYNKTTFDTRKLFINNSSNKSQSSSGTINKQYKMNYQTEASMKSNKNNLQSNTGNPKAQIRYFKIKSQKDVKTNRELYYLKIVRSCFLWLGTVLAVFGQLKIGIYPLIIWTILKIPTLSFGEPINPKDVKNNVSELNKKP